jgi:hypothetical protein
LSRQTETSSSQIAYQKRFEENRQRCHVLAPASAPCTFPAEIPSSPCLGAFIVSKPGTSVEKIGGKNSLTEECQFICLKGQTVSRSTAGQEIANHKQAKEVISQSYLVEAKTGLIGVTASHLWEARDQEKKPKKSASSAESNSSPAKEKRDCKDIKEYHTESNCGKGIQVHKEYKKGLDNPEMKLEKEYVLPSKKKIDFIDHSSDPIYVYELKPNNTRSISRAKRQVETYIQELKTMQDFKDRQIIGIIEVY